MREGLNQPWLVLVLAAFCFPLFIGLGSSDLGNDEAIYSYAVESILTTGDWLSPRSSPNADIPFLEKPPLKFWIVAAPIWFGLLPYNEFGLRFWDAVFGTLAFVYVFLLGRRAGGAVSGLMAVLVLFAHGPLLFEHGLRSNNMDAALVLAYCGGVYHFLRWTTGADARGRAKQIAAVAGWFFLGFMTKFVAALFLPFVLGVTALMLPGPRRVLAQDWRRWLLAGTAVLALALPWFLYQAAVRGDEVWRVMFGEHVFTRFTQYADPLHVQPWHFYIRQAWTELTRAGSAIWVVFGLAVVVTHAARRRRTEDVVILLWLVLPVALISLGSSKLYHYFYPYLPPLALAAGAGVAWTAAALCSRLAGITILDWRAAGWLRIAGGVLAVAGAGVALATAIEGGVRLAVGQQVIFRNTSLARPIVVALAGLLLAVPLRTGALLALAMLLQLAVPTPLSAYAANLKQLRVRHRPLGALSTCLRETAARNAAAGAGAVYAPVSEEAFLHPYFYYLRGEGWHLSEADDATVRAALSAEERPRPVVIDRQRFAAFLERTGPLPRPPIQIPQPTVVILLPGPFEECSAAYLAGRR